MSKVLWHTMTIKVPSEMVEITKTGKVSIKKTLTKMNMEAKSRWSEEQMNAERQRLREEIAKKENELNRLKKQLELLDDAIYIFTV